MGPLPERTHDFPARRFCADVAILRAIIEVGDGLHAFGKHGEITSMDKDVAIRHIHLAMKLMRVAEENKAQCGFP
jgi:hypothetical protein